MQNPYGNTVRATISTSEFSLQRHQTCPMPCSLLCYATLWLYLTYMKLIHRCFWHFIALNWPRVGHHKPWYTWFDSATAVFFLGGRALTNKDKPRWLPGNCLLRAVPTQRDGNFCKREKKIWRKHKTHGNRFGKSDRCFPPCGIIVHCHR